MGLAIVIITMTARGVAAPGSTGPSPVGDKPEGNMAPSLQ